MCTTSETGSRHQLFTKKLLAKTTQVMEMAFKLLPFASFMEVLAGLMQKTQLAIKKKSLVLLTNVLRNTEMLDDEEVSFF